MCLLFFSTTNNLITVTVSTFLDGNDMSWVSCLFILILF